MLHWVIAVVTALAAAPEAVEEWDQGGNTVVFVSDDRAPLVHVRVLFPVGRYSDWFEEHHGSEALRFMTRTEDGRLRARASELAVDVSATVGLRWSSVRVSGLAEDLPQIRALLDDILTHDDYDRRALARARRVSRNQWKEYRKSPRSWQWRAAMDQLVAEPDDPRARVYREPDRISKDVEALAATRAQIVSLPGRIVGVAGAVTEEEVRALVDGLPPIRDDVPDDLAPRYGPLATRPERHRITLPRLTQVYFTLYRDSLTLDDPDRPAALVAEHVLGGHFYSRLSVAMRHEGGHTYGAGSFADARVVPSLHAILTFTRSDNADAAEQTLLRTLRTFHADGLTEQERAEAVSTLKGRRAFANLSPRQVLGRRLSELQNALPPGYSDALVEKAAALPLDAVNAFVAEHYDPARFTLLRVEPE